MAEAALHREDIETDENSGTTRNSVEVPPKKKRRTPKDDIADLESKWETKFNSLDSKLDKLTSILADKVQDTGTPGARRPMNLWENNPAVVSRPDIEQDDDVLSVLANQHELRELDVESTDSDVRSNLEEPSTSLQRNSDRFSRILPDSNNFLKDLFGDDAQTKPSSEVCGIVLDESQIQVLNNTWRIKNPSTITAYKEEYRMNFPVSEKSTDILSVPQLDVMLEHLLISKYGSKAAAASGRSLTLHSQPLKSIEKLAFQGQTAARYGIITTSYLQQALGTLLAKLTDKSSAPSLDSIIQLVRDTFAVSTKVLDQVARTGAYHHLIRRKSATEDSGLVDIREIKNQVMDLPLSNEGVFGKDLESKLKERAEKSKQLKELLPELNNSKRSSSDTKRKYSSVGQTSGSQSSATATRSDRFTFNSTRGGMSARPSGFKPRQGSATETKSFSNFRIPKKDQRK